MGRFAPGVCVAISFLVAMENEIRLSKQATSHILLPTRLWRSCGPSWRVRDCLLRLDATSSNIARRNYRELHFCLRLPGASAQVQFIRKEGSPPSQKRWRESNVERDARAR